MENNNNIHILLIEDNPGDARLIGEMLAESSGVAFQVKYVNRLEAGLRYLDAGGIDVALVDLDLPDSKGADTLEAVRSRSARLPMLVLTGLENETMAARAVHDGAQDYLVKGQLDANLLIRAILYSIQRHRLMFELRQYALRLHTSHFRLQTIMEQNADGIIIANEQGLILYVNPAAEAILGKRRDELQNQPIGIPIFNSEATEIEIVQPTGEIVVTEVRLVEIEWEGDVAYLASVRDITERRRVREILGQAAKEWQHTFDAVEDMIVVLDRDHRIIRANQAVKDRFNTPIFGEHCHQLFHGTHDCIDKCTARTTFDSGEASHEEIQEEHLGDRWFLTSAYPIKDLGGSVDKVVHVLRDITEEKRSAAITRSLEAKKLVLEELQKVNEIKSQFIEVMAHELRTPMTVIRSGVGLLLDQSLGELNDKQKDFLRVIERNIDRLARFSQDVLSLSKLDSGRINITAEESLLYDVLQPTLEMLKVKAAEEKITVDYSGLAGDELMVLVDADALCQVGFNLVNNAIMHCPGGTTVTLAGRLLENEFVEVTVSDDGNGIPPEALGRIFERFYQVGRKSGPGYRGTGIGLAVCKGLVDKMGGRIFVDSELDQGTSFRFLLPTAGARTETLFGRIAAFLGYVTQDQLKEAVELQMNSERHRDSKIGEILMQQGRLTRVEVNEVLQNQQFSLSRPHPRLPTSISESLLGQLARKYEYVNEEQLREVLRDQALHEEQGEPVRIGQVLVEKDLMTPEDIIMVLHMQKQQIVACPSCWTRFNANRTRPDDELTCPLCAKQLQLDESQEIDVDGDVT